MNRDAVVIIGSGLMGAGIACRSALDGNPTILVDTELQKAMLGVRRANDCIGELLENGLCTEQAAQTANSLLQASADMHAALDQARLAIEAVYENLELKQALFEQLDAMLPPAIPILSNTSGLRISEIAQRTKHPERTVTAHFWYPAHLVPLVEVVMGEHSLLEIAQAVRDELNRWGKKAVIVRRDRPGQLANRILQAIMREAIDMVATGLATPEDVDTAVKMGMGIRFPAWGPLEHVDAVGVDLVWSTQTTVLPDLNNQPLPNPYLTMLKQEGNLGYKTGKGFYDWSTRNMKDLEKKRNRFIIDALKALNL